LIRSYLYAPDMPDPDLVIRTSGEFRISNFLLWELAYSELVFTDVLWPDFRRENLFEAVREYQRRERRFGSIEEE
jgi:undecaprenyl diphosphate synthase